MAPLVGVKRRGWKVLEGKVGERVRLCLVIIFIFYFQKLVFGNVKKNNFLIFLKLKHVWLVEIKKKNIFLKKKKKILKYVVPKIWILMLTH